MPSELRTATRLDGFMSRRFSRLRTPANSLHLMERGSLSETKADKEAASESWQQCLLQVAPCVQNGENL
jgi:hypothetical protein